MAVGFSTFILMALFVQDEFSWDKNHKKHERLFAIQPIAHLADKNEYWRSTRDIPAEVLEEEFPEIEYAMSSRPTWGGYLSSAVKNEPFTKKTDFTLIRQFSIAMFYPITLFKE
jgi:hypothetical protein